MVSSLFVLLALQTPLALPELERGTHLQYTGRFAAERGDPAAVDKTFQLSLFVAKAQANKLKAYWTLAEQGHGGWNWLQHFGVTEVDRGSTKHQFHGPALLYVRPQGTAVVPILFPFLNYPAEIGGLEQGKSWTAGRLNYLVEQTDRAAGRNAWQVAVTNAYGRKRTLWVDVQSQMILAAEETVFVGQGEKHRLRFQLVAQEPLPVQQTDPTMNALDSLVQLRNELGVEPQERDVIWTADRLKLLAQQLPGLQKQTQVKPLAKLVQNATRDLKRQENQSGAIASVKTRLLGKTAPHPKLTDLRGKAFDWSTTKQRVTVLHFWEYRDVPLEEPYGQTAYVDFLFRNREADQVNVLGIAVDDRLTDSSTRRAGVRSVKKLRAFMNLSYPILLDGGEAIRQFGDPRATGAKLPLFVVVDTSGKIAHYHVGHYEVDRDRGLEELDRVVKQVSGTLE